MAPVNKNVKMVIFLISVNRLNHLSLLGGKGLNVPQLGCQWLPIILRKETQVEAVVDMLFQHVGCDKRKCGGSSYQCWLQK